MILCEEPGSKSSVRTCVSMIFLCTCSSSCNNDVGESHESFDVPSVDNHDRDNLDRDNNN